MNALNGYRTWLEHRSVIRAASACTSVFRFELRPSWFPLRTRTPPPAAAATPSPTRRMKTTFTATAEAFALSSISAPAYPTPINSEFHSATPDIVATRTVRGWAAKSPAMAGAIKPCYDFKYAVRRLQSNKEFRSELSITVGSKGYHTEKFVDGPYPWNK